METHDRSISYSGKTLDAQLSQIAISADYRRSILSTIDRVCVKRITEIIGRAPLTIDRLRCQYLVINADTGAVQVTFMHENISHPLCQFLPAGFDKDGRWRDAEISELTWNEEAVAEAASILNREEILPNGEVIRIRSL